jgi:uncharacterized protein YjbI with pentapeptide repeats
MNERVPFPPLANILDRLLEQATRNVSPSFRDLAKAAALDPASDFVGASLRDIDFRDEDLRGFDFSNADLTGADFRRANVKGVRFAGATLHSAIGLTADGEKLAVVCSNARAGEHDDFHHTVTNALSEAEHASIIADENDYGQCA